MTLSSAPDGGDEAIIGGPGWAIQRVGPWVLGHWNDSLDETRVIECRTLYRAARDAHGRFQVLAVFRGYPFALDLVFADRARKLVLSLMDEIAPDVDALIFPIEGTGLKGAIMRSAAAGIVHQLWTRMPISFPSSLEEGLTIARDKRLFTPAYPESVIRNRMVDLESRAHW